MTFDGVNRQPLRVFRSGLNWRGQWKLTDAAVLRAAHGCVGKVPELLVGALSNILVFLGEEREWMRVDREGENEPR